MTGLEASLAFVCVFMVCFTVMFSITLICSTLEVREGMRRGYLKGADKQWRPYADGSYPANTPLSNTKCCN